MALLPQLGEVALYQQFRLNESWDSPHNIQLVSKMPQIYALPSRTADAGMTFFQVFYGEPTIFEERFSLAINTIRDGSSNTILIAEAADTVPWTAPQDLPFHAPTVPIPKLGAAGPTAFLPRPRTARFIS